MVWNGARHACALRPASRTLSVPSSDAVLALSPDAYAFFSASKVLVAEARSAIFDDYDPLLYFKTCVFPRGTVNPPLLRTARRSRRVECTCSRARAARWVSASSRVSLVKEKP